MKTATRSVLLGIAGALVLAAAPGARAQQKQTVTYKVSAADTRIVERHRFDVGDAPGHSLVQYKLHRVFGEDAPRVKGKRVEDIWTWGQGDFLDNYGTSQNYSLFMLENGDTFFVKSTAVGKPDATGRLATSSVGQVTGGTGKLAGMQGVFRSQGITERKTGYNETSAELIYWFAK
jgi:hypothetical protein